ncbi:DUF3592 domain-containing protein [uncultured Cohaesibacter sp.]|uniref:DUF3592 domain-containing protein n=1 Tax=uncultured Cohaesibacter sp. TaxID=1002546 RepID=UPI0029C6B119|nr:DUF3592 domain-containing protein [uncultured Cohaesibacter sp.]
MRYQSAYRYPGADHIDRERFKDKASAGGDLKARKSQPVKLIDVVKFALMLVGLALFIVGIAHYFTAQDIKSWHQKEVTITRADVVRLPVADGSPVFTAQVEYEFVHNGELISGNKLSLTKIRSKSPGVVKKEIAAYWEGRTVLAHVNPQQSDENFLKSNPLAYIFWLIAPGLVLMFASLLISQIQYRRRMKLQRKAWRFGEFNALVPQPVESRKR